MEQIGLRLEVAQGPKSLLRPAVQKICQNSRL